MEIDLLSDCGDRCLVKAMKLRDELSSSYGDNASILRLEDTWAYLATHRTARKRAQRCRNKGYHFETLKRELHGPEITAINTSLEERQGRPMTQWYQEKVEFSPLPEYDCPDHAYRTYGVWDGRDNLVAYIVLLICGEQILISQLLGHGDHLQQDIMYLLVTDAIAAVVDDLGPKTVFYNRHDSGTDGLRYFKERLGFQAKKVTWTL